METQEARKTLIYYHGGGFIFGEERTLAVMVAKQLGVQVISVKYRLSPEHPFPVPIEDCVNATRYIFENENQLKIGKFGVYGESAGGHLALSVTMKVDYMALCGRLPEVVSAIVPMGQCLYMDTPSFLDKWLQQENTGSDIARMCWLGFAGLDVHDRKLNRVMAENRHLSSETRQSLSALLPRDCLRGKRVGFKKPTKVRPEVYIEIEEDPTVAAFQSRLQVLLEHDEYVFSPGTTSDENMMKLLKNTKKLVVSCASMDILRDDGLLIYHRLKNLVEKQRLSSTDLELVVYENVGHLFMYTNKYVSNRVGYSGYTPAADKLLQTLKF